MKRSLFFAFAVVLLMVSCQTEQPMKQLKLEGPTMGTSYHITYMDSLGLDYQQQVDSVLSVVNQSMSTYIPTSLISQFNQMDSTGSVMVDEHFGLVMELAQQVYWKSDGAFDPTVMPLVNAFGFGFENLEQVDSVLIDSLKGFVAFDSVDLIYIVDPKTLTEVVRIDKKKTGIQLDFSAIAKGYGVDAVGRLLESKGVTNYMVEIGGEVRCRGNNIQGKPWRIGVEKPVEGNAGDYEVIANLTNISMATSGNYRNYRVSNGQKYVHTINPKTGWPEMNNTLSVSILAEDCATADAYATAGMVMGVDKAFPMISELEGVEAYFIYADSTGEMQTLATAGFKQVLTDIP